MSYLKIQALWRTLRNPADSISHVAYRVLGKFGGSNRKMLKESQKLQYVVTEIQGPSITIEFSDCKASIQLPMEKVRTFLRTKGIIYAKKLPCSVFLRYRLFESLFAYKVKKKNT